MAGLTSCGRNNANGRLLRRLSGKVKPVELIEALRRNGYNDLADKIEGIL